MATVVGVAGETAHRLGKLPRAADGLGPPPLQQRPGLAEAHEDVLLRIGGGAADAHAQQLRVAQDGVER